MGFWNGMNQAHFRQKKLGEMLLEASLIDEDQLKVALVKQQRSCKRLGEIMVNLGYAQEELILGLVGKQLAAPYIKISDAEKIDNRILGAIPGNLARRNLVLPFRAEEDTLWVAMSDPGNQFLKKILSLVTGYSIKSHIASPKELKQAIAHYYSPQPRLSSTVGAEKSYFLPLKQLGLIPGQLQMLKKHLEHQQGLILFIGPEKSGKKTTMYGCLGQLNFPDNDIVCVEKNIDYKFDSINQIALNGSAPKELNQVLEWVDKFNPNIVAIEGLEKPENWRVAGRMAEKGNLVLATINSEKGIADFLADFAVWNISYTVIENLALVVFQKFIKEVCPFCKMPIPLSKASAKKIGLRENQEVTVFKGKGCALCDFTGYFDNTACFELLPVTAFLKDVLIRKKEGATVQSIISREIENKFLETVRHKLLHGQISIEEYMFLTNQDMANFREIREYEFTEVLWQAFERSGSVQSYLSYNAKRKAIAPFTKRT